MEQAYLVLLAVLLVQMLTMYRGLCQDIRRVKTYNVPYESAAAVPARSIAKNILC